MVLGDDDDDDDWLTCLFDHSRVSKVAALITIMSLLQLTGDVKRQVGVCLKNLPSPSPSPSGDSSRTKPRFHSGNVPWQRVINAKGGISPRSAPSSWRQRLVCLCVCLLTEHKEDQVQRRTKLMLYGGRV